MTPPTSAPTAHVQTLPRLPRATPESPIDGPVRGEARRFLQAVLEMAGADRPVIQLLRRATPEVYAEVSRRAELAAGGSHACIRFRTGRPRIVSMHLQRPVADVVEVAARVRHVGRSRALAARLERRDGHWICTALQLG